MIALEIHICDQRRSYVAKFSTEDQAVRFVQARQSTHAISEVAEMDKSAEPVPVEWTRLLDLLYPMCEHQMSLSSCYGPDHFMSADQERAMGWDYSDAPAGF